MTLVGHEFTNLGSGDATIAIAIELLEDLLHFFRRVGVQHLAGHECHELMQVHGAAAISIDFIEHFLKLSLSEVVTKLLQRSAELLDGELAITVRIEMGESCA